ncbi:MAG: hypothetical protein KGY54_01025 [Oleiphilaceae bacterium]|nr:hypothetical protein [Oleiphilaceae bacterium]
MSNPIDVSLQPTLGAGLIAAAPWMVVALAAAILGAQGSTLLWLFCPVGALGAWRQVRISGLLKSPGSITRLTVKDSRLHAHFADGRCFVAMPASESRIFGRLALLKLQLDKAARVQPPLVVLFNSGSMGAVSGNVHSDDFRRLRVWLKLGASEPRPTHSR